MKSIDDYKYKYATWHEDSVSNSFGNWYGEIWEEESGKRINVYKTSACTSHRQAAIQVFHWIYGHGEENVWLENKINSYWYK